MTGVRFLCILVALPFLAVLAHDGYVYYDSTYEKGENLPLRLSDLGYLWQTYAPGSLELFKQSVSPETWDGWVVPVLRLPSLVVAGAFAAVVYGVLTLLWLFSLWPFEKEAVYNRGKSFLPGEKKVVFKYKRR